MTGAERQRLWRERNPDKVKEQSIKKRDLVRRRRYWLQKYKVAKGCECCGYSDHPAALDFDHLDPSEKKINIMARLSDSLKKIINEVRKCRVICANCHRIHSANQVSFKE